MPETQTARPFIHITRLPNPDDPTGYNLAVKAGDGVDSTDEVVTMLLIVVENITGVSSGLYAKEIDIARRVARGGPLFPDDLEYDDDTP